ncbi:MAG: hypothetical protein ACI9KE_006528 [Polyangiales bacterium]|jgi:hypothetical protein
MNTVAGSSAPPPDSERLIVWHRLLLPTRPEQDDPAAAADWVSAVSVRGSGAGGLVLSRVGGSVALAFELVDVHQALEFCLGLLSEADELGGTHGPRIALGLATGTFFPQGDWFGGSSIDRAQLLASRARHGELVLDEPTRDAVEMTYLFGRSIGSGVSSIRGFAIDRSVPRRSACRAWIRELQRAPVPASTAAALYEIRSRAAKPNGSDCIILRGSGANGSGAFLDDLAEELKPSVMLHFAGVPGGLEPLGSLRLALSREWGSGPRLEAALGAGSSSLGRVARGMPVEKMQLFDELSMLIGRLAETGRPWFVFDPLSSIDPTTLGLVAGLSQCTPLFLVVRAPAGGVLPGPFAELPWREFHLPVLSHDDARTTARVILGAGTDDDVVERVAQFGGESVLGVEEAARALVCSGDLVFDGLCFRWRRDPRPGTTAIPVVRLISERLETLDETASRMLEVICVSPPGTPRLLGAAIAERDGLSAERRGDATQQLSQEGYLAAGSQLQPYSEVLRSVVLRGMPAGRLAELHRFVADAMSASSLFPGPLSRATTGYFLAEGGNALEGAIATLDAARAALNANMRHAARRLAAAAVQIHPLVEVRQAAADIARDAAEDEVTGDEVPERLAARAVTSLLSGHFDAVDDQLDMAIAEGRDLGATHRLRAINALGRGDTNAAFSAFEKAHAKAGDNIGAQARASLTLAWVLLHDGDGESCVRAGLAALAAARRMKDPRGEAAAMHTLSAAMRAMGRESDAAAIAEAAPV